MTGQKLLPRMAVGASQLACPSFPIVCLVSPFPSLQMRNTHTNESKSNSMLDSYRKSTSYRMTYTREAGGKPQRFAKRHNREGAKSDSAALPSKQFSSIILCRTWCFLWGYPNHASMPVPLYLWTVPPFPRPLVHTVLKTPARARAQFVISTRLSSSKVIKTKFHE